MRLHKLCVLLFTGIHLMGYSQSYSTSPYSSAGIGELGTLPEAQFAGMGNTSVALADSIYANSSNPASYVHLSPGAPLMSFGISARISRYETGDFSKTSGAAGIPQLMLAFPVKPWFGFAFGMQAYSRKGYGFYERAFAYNDSITHQYVGNGTTNRAFLGTAFRILNTSHHRLSIGTNLSYLFGTVTDERRAFFDDNGAAGAVDIRGTRLKSFHYDLGLNYRIAFQKGRVNHLTFGALYTPQLNLNAQQDRGVYWATNVSNQDTYDTLTLVENTDGTIVMPARMTLGFSYQFRPANADGKLKNIYQLIVNGEFTSCDYGSYSERFGTQTTSSELVGETKRFALGAEFTPSSVYVSKAAGSSFLNRFRYRLGAYYQTLPYSQNGVQFSENAVTAGIGVPLGGQKSNSSLHIGFQYGNRSADKNTGFNERFVGISFGIIIGPSSYDKWFKRYKLD